MSPRVDTHVLLLPSTRQDWWEQCRVSLENEPIHLHVTDGVEGHIGQARAKGFSLGESPYISCVDHDDIVVPGAFQACIDALEANPNACGAYTDEMVIDEAGKEIKPGIWQGTPWNPLLQLEPKYIHHIYVMRREAVTPHLSELAERWPRLAEFVLKGLICEYGPWIHVDRIGYKWRLHNENGHRQYPVTDLYAARWRVIPTLYTAAQKVGAKLPTPKVL